jgi:ParB family chromosome partitioning protein
MSDQTEAPVTNETLRANPAFDNIPDEFAPLDQIGVAPENLRAEEGPDEDIAQLADTLFYAGQIHSLLVRPGKGKKEAPFMALDGRRRRFAWLHNVAQGRVPADQPIRIKVIHDRALQIAAATLPNTEQQPPDLVHVIRAVGRLVQRKMSPSEIAKALGGYTVREVAGWAALSSLEDAALEGLRAGKITLRQAKLMTKLSAQDQRQLAEHASLYGRLYDDAVRQRVNGAVVTVGDARVRLATLAAYKAAGGRIESDLFGEMPDLLLDQAVLQQVWDEKVAPLVDHLKAAGLEVFFDIYPHFAPEGFETLPHLVNLEVADDLQDAVSGLEGERALAAAAVGELETLGDDSRGRILDLLTLEIDYLKLHGLALGACNLAADGEMGVKATFFALPQPEPEANGEEEDDAGALEPAEAPVSVRRYGDVEVPRVELSTGATSHALVERYTDIATRGLVRTLADQPDAALVLLVARLFVCTALARTCDDHVNSSISTLKAQAYRRTGHAPLAALDGEVFASLEASRAAFLDSGLRPIPWVASLTHDARMTLLAEVMAVTLDGREVATHAARHGARAEALELAELTGHDIKAFWIPDLDFFSAHNKAQLLAMLDQMGEPAAAAAALKKADLAARVTAAAGDRHWAPDALSWKAVAPSEPEADGSGQTEVETPDGDGDHDGEGGAVAPEGQPGDAAGLAAAA